MATVPQETDFIVVGAGVAGLRAAIGLAGAGRVLVLTKQEITESATQYAQGGVAVVLSDEDEIELHLQDTIDAGDGLVNEAAAKVLVEEGPDRIQELLDWGTAFDRKDNKLTFTREGAHSRSRILHAHGDSTGREMGRALAAKARSLSNITFSEFEFTTDLHIDAGRACGINVLSADGLQHTVLAHSILLATGGAGQIYRDTTNPPVATADGVAMAFRAGAEISDMEFIQFHPTALYLPGAPRFLLSEALRGEGAHLKNFAGERFMVAQHPLAELAPRDVVARAIARQILQSLEGEQVVYLDMRHLDAAHLAKRFPRIHQTCLRYGVDITRDLVPIRPAAHYLMGGVKSDLQARSTLPGLYAAGETACTGVHGANRLASNSLLEGIVFGARAAQAMLEEARLQHCGAVAPRQMERADDATAERLADIIRNVMWRNAGVVRHGGGLREALGIIDNLKDRMPARASRATCEAANIRDAASLTLLSALARQESRGAHYRTDFPEARKEFRRHSVVRQGMVSFE